MAVSSKNFEKLIQSRLDASIETKKGLYSECELIAEIAGKLIDAYRAGKKVLLFGNGGSAADAQHIAAELLGRYYLDRKALPAMALTVNSSSVTATANDYGFDQIFARQIEAFGNVGDVAIGISTSGTSRNVIKGLGAAKGKGMTTVAMTGQDRAGLEEVSDHIICVPSADTPRIQESHILIGHILSELIEQTLFGHLSTSP
jgi:D-sedoheptulose 7-phosphate isomerase